MRSHHRGRILAGLVAAAFVLSASCGGNDSTGPTCSFAISPGSRSFGSDGGSGSVTVTAGAGCAWTAAASAGWIAIGSGASGSGAGTVAYTVAAQTASESRSGTLTIAGQAHTVTQEGRPATVCTYGIAPGGATYSKDEATGSFGVTAPAGCAWSASSGASWITVTSGQGSGDGTVSYAITRNRDVADRNGTIAVADRTFTIRQIGDAPACEYSVAPVELQPCMAAGSVSTNVTTAANCAWTVAPAAAWLGVPGGGSRTGPGTITITFTENYSAPRQGVVQVRWDTPTAGQNVIVSQAGCLYSVSRSDITIAAAGGSGTFDVLQMAQPNSCGGPLQDRCVWSAVSDVTWITISGSMPRSGDNPVSFTVAPNTSGAVRTGRITVRDKVVVVTQGL